jgi:hypothetical protein
MTDSSPACPACGNPGSGKFCSNCGAVRESVGCSSCGAQVSPAARFCSACGQPAGGGTAAGPDRTPWIVAGVALAGLLAVLLIMVARDSKVAPAEASVAATPASQPVEAPPDISNMSARERFNALYNRVMRAAQSGDEATVSRFTPMALVAYSQLDTIDADARYHAALLKVHTGDADAARALGDTIVAQDPAHLFGFVVRGTVARFRKDEKELSRAYSGFLKQYDKEIKLERPEYSEHQTSLNDFRKAALAASPGSGGGS